MERGYFKVWRKIADCRSWSRGLEYRGLMLTLLEKANWKRGYFLGRELLPGQLACSGSGLAEELGVSRFRLLRMLKTLESDGFIARSGDSFCTWIRIVHWQVYQVTEEAPAQTAHNGRTALAQAAHTIKEGKKARKEIPSASADAGEGEALLVYEERQEEERQQREERPPVSLGEAVVPEAIASEADTPEALASPGAEQGAEPGAALGTDSGAEAEPSEIYRTASRRLLKGRKLAWFRKVWEAFGYRRNKAEAADAFLCIEGLSTALVERVCAAAQREAERRPDLVARGKTPKLLTGWLQGRRWEDEPEVSLSVLPAPPALPVLVVQPAPAVPDIPVPSEEDWEAGRALLEKWRRGELPTPAAGSLDRRKPFPVPGVFSPAAAGAGAETPC